MEIMNMVVSKGAATKEDLINLKLPGHRPGLPGKVTLFYIVPLDPAHRAGLAGHAPAKEKMVHQFHIISEDVISQVKQVAEGVTNVNEKLDRRSQELKNEIQETRQEILAAIKFSYAELDKRISTLEKDFLDLKHRVERIESRSTP